jgi:CubicO group peptidase (beta-lactamase class C family)
MAIGIHGQYLYVNPVARVVIVVWGARPQPTQGQIVDDWSFCDAVTTALWRGRTEPE